MNLAIYDPPGPLQHEYLTKMYFAPLRKYCLNNGISCHDYALAHAIKDGIILTSADRLTPKQVEDFKNNGNKIVGFSVTDSSYIAQPCREAFTLAQIDLMFMLTGIQKINEGYELVVDKDYNPQLEKRQFLPDEDWVAFNMMRLSGRLQSLPYVHWDRQPIMDGRPYATRNQQVLIRGGNHMRRFILALELLKIGKIDCNSGFVTEPYFKDDMVPQFRYCDDCRNEYRGKGFYPWNLGLPCSCERPPISDLGQWNNKSPRVFYEFAEKYGAVPSYVERLMNQRWLSATEHLSMLARITFTSDLKWLFSIYAAQRFWDAASVGCVNLLPCRTADQDYFPVMEPYQHYLVYYEKMSEIGDDASVSEDGYDRISTNAKSLYETWIRPTEYTINTNLIKHILETIDTIR